MPLSSPRALALVGTEGPEERGAGPTLEDLWGREEEGKAECDACEPNPSEDATPEYAQMHSEEDKIRTWLCLQAKHTCMMRETWTYKSYRRVRVQNNRRLRKRGMRPTRWLQAAQ